MATNDAIIEKAPKKPATRGGARASPEPWAPRILEKAMRPLSSDDGVFRQRRDVPPEGVDVLEPIGLQGMQACSINEREAVASTSKPGRDDDVDRSGRS